MLSEKDTSRILGILRHALAQSTIHPLKTICDILYKEVAHYDWVGIYHCDLTEKLLRLGDYAGAATEHTVIAYGTGVCGQCAVSKEPIVVQDVCAESNYLSCSVHVKAEIVVPIVVNGEMLALLDINSHSTAPFCSHDEILLDEVVGMIVSLNI